jgi:hypothetical protein
MMRAKPTKNIIIIFGYSTELVLEEAMDLLSDSYRWNEWTIKASVNDLGYWLHG